MKQRINRIPAINWIKKKNIPEYADIVLVNIPEKKEVTELLKKRINDTMNLDDVPIIIRKMTHPFNEAFMSAMPKLMDQKIWTSLECNDNYTGVLLTNEVIYYRFTKRPEAFDYDLCIAVFDKNTTLLFYTVQVSGLKTNSFINPLHKSRMRAISASIEGVPNNNDADDDKLNSQIRGFYYRIVIAFELFRKYADVKVKMLQPKMKVELFKCKYHNDNDHQIEIMDSTWFTDFVRSEAFKVRGHFRLQAFGTNLSERKIVWIKDFKKEGYTRKARKELEIA
jgi:hypothetical protein